MKIFSNEEPSMDSRAIHSPLLLSPLQPDSLLHSSPVFRENEFLDPFSPCRYLSLLSNYTVPEGGLCSFPDPIQPAMEQSKQITKSKRGRKKKNITEEERAEIIKQKVEKNRRCAKEHREKQKEYIARLENRIKYLEAELTTCRNHLQNYETREKHYIRNSLDIFNKLVNDFRIFQQTTLQSLSQAVESNLSVSTIIKRYEYISEENNYSIKLMSQALMNVYMPPPLRCLFEATGSKEKFFTMAQQGKTFSLEEFENYLSKTSLSSSEITELKKFGRSFTEIANNVSGNLFQFHNCIQKLLESHKEIDQVLQSEILPKISSQHYLAFIKSVKSGMDRMPVSPNSGYFINETVRPLSCIEYSLSPADSEASN